MDIICDIDGTLADLSHRRHWIENAPKNWKAFFTGIDRDEIIIPVAKVIQSLSKTFTIIFCSGRPEHTRADTIRWIETNIKVAGPLYMRKANDFRRDDDVKKELLEEMKRDGFKPMIAFEDRKQVKRMWVENGIFVFDVNQYDKEF